MGPYYRAGLVAVALEIEHHTRKRPFSTTGETKARDWGQKIDVV